MSNLVFAEKEPAAPPPDLAEITSGAFWPPLALADVRTAVRIDHTVTHQRLRYAVSAAVVYVNQQLSAFQAAMQQKGIATLAAINPQAQINGITVAEHHYRRAVYACVQADLAEAYRDVDVTPQSAGKVERVADRIELRIGEHRRAQRWAISDLLGIRRTTVDLV